MIIPLASRYTVTTSRNAAIPLNKLLSGSATYPLTKYSTLAAANKTGLSLYGILDTGISKSSTTYINITVNQFNLIG
jgi:hypothetical protein